MTELRPIQTLNLQDVRALLLEAMRSDLPARALRELLASVDWSIVIGPVPEDVADLLDAAEQLATKYEEGDRTLDELGQEITRLASAGARVARKRLTPD